MACYELMSVPESIMEHCRGSWSRVYSGVRWLGVRVVVSIPRCVVTRCESVIVCVPRCVVVGVSVSLRVC